MRACHSCPAGRPRDLSESTLRASSRSCCGGHRCYGAALFLSGFAGSRGGCHQLVCAGLRVQLQNVPGQEASVPLPGRHELNCLLDTLRQADCTMLFPRCFNIPGGRGSHFVGVKRGSELCTLTDRRKTAWVCCVYQSLVCHLLAQIHLLNFYVKVLEALQAASTALTAAGLEVSTSGLLSLPKLAESLRQGICVSCSEAGCLPPGWVVATGCNRTGVCYSGVTD